MMEEMKKKKFGMAKGCLIIVAATVLTILVVIAGVYFYNKSYGMSRAEQTVTEYLQKKYNREFVVTNGHYIWATGTYTFDASPKDDPEFKFPVFSGSKFYENGIGDMYGLAREGRAARLLIKPYVESISQNYFCSAAFDSGPTDKYPYPILSDIRRNNLTPLEATTKYPGKISLNAGISYALDVTDANKEKIFKDVYALIEFLKQKNFGYIGVVIYFFPLSSDTGKAIINKTYSESKPGWIFGANHSIAIGAKALPDIKEWQDIEDYFTRWDTKNKRWVKDKTLTQVQNNKNTTREIEK